jgi:hypothetical protein
MSEQVYALLSPVLNSCSCAVSIFHHVGHRAGSAGMARSQCRGPLLNCDYLRSEHNHPDMESRLWSQEQTQDATL